MKIDKVTITGADDKVNQIDLINLSIKYPFVEWAILFSNSRQGQERYPSENWKTKFDTLSRLMPGSNKQVAAHFCGWYSSEVLENSNIDLLKNLSSVFKRVQINYNFKRSKNWNLTPVLEYAKENPDRSIIFQYNLNNADFLIDAIIGTNKDPLSIAIQAIKDGYEKMYESENVPKNVQFLFDSSGGNGLYDDTLFYTEPILDYYTGYAGGINCENIESICEIISSNKNADHHHPNNTNCWIDLESGVRTNNEFDLEKVETILRITSKFVGK
jgi:hypothetical protein